MSSRTYLSIGDVLALLRQEFPDVTISKIRFLESQGLVNPERTPSGYRKFYEHDVERLRWVLRQQREHFLPLKVIKGRLEEEGGDAEVAAIDGGFDTVHAEHPEPVLVGRAGNPARVGGDLAGREARTEQPRRRSLASPPVPLRPPSRVGTTADSGSTRPGSAPGPGAKPGALAARRAGPAPAPGPKPDNSRATARSAGPPAGGGRAPSPTKPTGTSLVSSAASAHAAGPLDVDGDADVGEALRTLSGTSMTVDEVAAGCGLEVAAVQELESYGLLCGRVVGGIAYYDEDALVVARLAAGLARYGVEARHLRLHKHAAEREAGFIEQIVLPLLKQRNPEARQRALDAVAELTLLGQGLREVLLRTALRDQLGG